MDFPLMAWQDFLRAVAKSRPIAKRWGPIPEQSVRFFLLAALIVTALLAGGCGDEREPIPVYNVEVLDETGAYTIDGQRMDERQLEAELRRLAEASRRNVTHTCRAQVYITSRLGGDQVRVEQVRSLCLSIGFVQISVGGR
jgi:hypothetical protein